MAVGDGQQKMLEQADIGRRVSSQETIVGESNLTPPSKEGSKPTKQVSAIERTLSRANTRHGKHGTRDDGKIVLHRNECYDELGFSFSSTKKWSILCVIFAIQCSMNFNAGVYGSAIDQLREEFGISAQKARVGQGLFLICYGLGCELWAPFSEELGRWPIMQVSLFLVNIWALGCALSQNFASIVVFRILGGFCSAGGSVTLAYVADMFEPEVHGHAVNFIVLSSVGGSVLGPIIGGFQARYLGYRWNFWLQLIFGGFVQFLHFWTPETKESILMDRIAKKRRSQGQPNVYSPTEVNGRNWSLMHILATISRPFVMFATEPIVLFLSLLSGFSDALIFTFLEAFPLVYAQYGWGTIANGLSFVAIGIGYLLAYFSFFPFINSNQRAIARSNDPEREVPPERRLYWLLYLAPCLPIGLFGFAWTSTGPPIPWIASQLFSAVVGIANFAIYGATIDYMINSYGEYSASATGGNGFSRDFLAGVATFYAAPLYHNLSNSQPLAWASTLLGFLAVCVVIPVYIVYWKGPQIRARSKFAVSLHEDKKSGKDVSEKNKSSVPA